VQHVHVNEGDRFSFWTHAVSAAASVAFLVLLVLRAQGTLAVTTMAIYAATLVVLFASSAFHHIVGSLGPRWYAFSRRLDHIAIFLLIAGTYTPVALVGFGGAWGWSIFGVIWGFALAGTGLKIWNPHTPRWVTTAIYLVMGWVALVAVWPIVQAFTLPALALLLGGGIAYSGGAVIYATKRPDPWPDAVGFHGIWHVFVMAGAGLHAALVWLYVA
jgi:hemolysin III